MKFNSKSITIKIDSIRDSFTTTPLKSYNKKRTEKRAKALDVLVAGNYNRYGRNINIDKYNEMRKEFENMIYEIEQIID